MVARAAPRSWEAAQLAGAPWRSAARRPPHPVGSIKCARSAASIGRAMLRAWEEMGMDQRQRVGCLAASPPPHRSPARPRMPSAPALPPSAPPSLPALPSPLRRRVAPPPSLASVRPPPPRTPAPHRRRRALLHSVVDRFASSAAEAPSPPRPRYCRSAGSRLHLGTASAAENSPRRRFAASPRLACPLRPLSSARAAAGLLLARMRLPSAAARCHHPRAIVLRRERWGRGERREKRG